MKGNKTIATWNVQRANIHGGRFGEIVKVCKRNGTDITFVTELNTFSHGIKKFETDGESMYLLHSTKTGVLMRGKWYRKWETEGRKWYPADRVTTVEFRDSILSSVYQPVRGSAQYEQQIQEVRRELERVTHGGTAKQVVVIGGDINAQIGRNIRAYDKSNTVGRYGFRRTNPQGEDQIEWLTEHGLCWVNSFFYMKKRGTWFNRGNRTWYEIDGFITREEDRHRIVKAVKIKSSEMLSDHKIVEMKLKMRTPRYSNERKQKKRRNINWEKMMNREIAEQYRKRTEERTSQETTRKGVSTEDLEWQTLCTILRTAAEEVCGKREKQTNPWMNKHEEEAMELKAEIRKALRERNRVIRQTGDKTSQEYDIAKARLAEKRANYKRELRQWEENWWNQLADECQQACQMGQIGRMYKILQRLQRRGEYNNSKTILLFTEEEFKGHLEKITHERYENSPDQILKTIEKIQDLTVEEETLERNNELIVQIPSFEEIKNEIAKMKDAAPGEDEIRLRYIREAGDEIKRSVYRKIQWLWVNPAHRWEDGQKVGIIIPLHKKGDKKDMNNFRGVCLLPIMSRILARILATRLRNWAEATGALDENQAGFRQGRSTADATQIFVRIQEDVKVVRNMEEISNEREERKEMAILLDLKKAYPRVSRPILWAVLEKYRLPNKVIDKLKDLHEFTSYRVRGEERDSTEFIPQRGLREGCATSPVIFNIFHQAVIRVAEKERVHEAEKRNKKVGIDWSFMPGHSLPPKNVKNTFNSEAKNTTLTISLFADDTTIIGMSDEIEEGKQIIEKVMGEFEERTNESKEEKMEFGAKDSEEIRMLGTYMGNEHDTNMRIKRAARTWMQIKKRFLKCKLSKKTQAKVVETCVESTILFNSAVRPFSQSEIKRIQSWIDKRYRYIWSNKKEEPLRQMERNHMNMQDVRNELDVMTIRSKLEKSHLERIGHIARMSDERLVKQTTMGWIRRLETGKKPRKRKMTTLSYWHKLLKEANIETHDVERIAMDRAKWKNMVKNRMRHIEQFEKQQGYQYRRQEDEELIERRSQYEIQNTNKCKYEGCCRTFRTKAGLVIHQKRLHRTIETATTFRCHKCNSEFRQEATLKNHSKVCKGEKIEGDRKECKICNNLVGRTNYARHVRRCRERNNLQEERAATERRSEQTHALTARKYVSKRTVCTYCGANVTATNLARHQKSRACMASDQ